MMTELAGTRFEETFKELADSVKRLEEGNLPLEEAIALYERGMKLAQVCNDLLDKAELRIQQLSPSPDGGYTAEPLPTEGEGFFEQ